MRIYPTRALNFIDRTGLKYGRLLVLRLAEKPKGCKRSYWICKCDCGKEVRIDAAGMVSGRSKSCGCLQIEITIARGKHQESGKGKTTAEYRAWCNMKTRCENPNTSHYKHYGGRGIVICERWASSFENFLSDMGRRPSSKHSVERIDTDKNYEPSNCKWGTDLEQSNNTRRNHFLEHDGKILTISQWSVVTGYRSGAILSRIRAGWSVERALTTPVKMKS